ncbi:MAG: M28 family metallopeptidase, partial [Thermoplasmatota archaeon]
MKKRTFSLFFAIMLFSSTSTLALSNYNNKVDVLLSTNDISVVDMIEQIDEELVSYYHTNLMSYGVRYTGTLNATFASAYIFEEFENMGLDVSFHEWTFAGYECRNVVATLPGTDSCSNAIYILCAHYDTVPGSIGANDDGSGVAAVLAAAKILSQYSFNHTLRFITFSGEEVGTYGSFSYARDAYRNKDNIIAVFNADMIGYANTTKGGKTIRFFQPDRSSWMADYASTIAEKYNDLIDLSVEKLPNYIGADHQAFIDYGYDGSWIAHYDGYPWGHTSEDTPDKMNWTYQVKATKLLLAIMAEISQKPIDVQIMLTSPRHGYGYLFSKPI